MTEPSRDCLSALLDLAPAGLVVLSAEGTVLEVNDAALALLGEESARVRGEPFSRFLPPEAAGAWQEHLDRPRAAGERSALRSTLRRPGEAPLPVRLLARPCARGTDALWLLSITGAPSGSDRPFAQAVLDALPSQVAVLDSAGSIVAVNRAWRRFAEENDASPRVRDGVGLDYLAACLRAKGSAADDAAEAAEGIRAVIEDGRPLFTLEYPCHSPDTQRWFLLTASPLGTADGGAVVAHIDVTTRRLAQQQARERQQALARAARLHTVGALSSALAHEIAQPLTAIGHFNYAALTLLGDRGPGADEVRALLRQTEDQVDRAATIVRRLKEFIRHGSLRREQSDVRRAVEDAVELIGHLAMRKRVQVRLQCPEHPAEAWIDGIQVTQVIVNLLCNSIEAIEQADAELREIDVRVTPQDEAVRVTVSDTGPGLDPAWGDRIFDVFETAKSTGAGIGLAVSRSIAEAHGGRLWAEPSSPRGAVFHLSLPVPTGHPGPVQS